MADTIITAVAQRLLDTGIQLVRNEVNLVRGVDKEVRDLSDQLMTIRNVLDDAEKKGLKDKSAKNWLKKLEYTCYEMDDVLDEWEYNLLKQRMEKSNADVAPKRKVSSFFPSPSSCLCFKKVSSRHHTATKIQRVKAQLDRILKEKDQFDFATCEPIDPSAGGGSGRGQSTLFVDVKNVFGREYDSNILMAKLMPNDDGQEELGIQMISIVGAGGMGKSTLAQLVYNDERVKNCFELRVWICVSDTSDLVKIVKGIAKNILGSSPDTNDLNILLGHLNNSIKGKKFLIVLDDVWGSSPTAKGYIDWEPLKICLKATGVGSKILVTTRDKRVATMMGTKENEIHHLRMLSDDECWLLLSHVAHFDRDTKECEKFENIGRKIAKKCEGLPLAAKTLGSLLRFKHSLEEWENVVDSEIWELEEAEVDIFPVLPLSYNELFFTLKRCFTYCAVFPKDYVIDVESLIRNWLALGYLGSNESTKIELELKGRQCFDSLAMHSLFQDLVRDDFKQHGIITKCKMHDIVHDFAQFLRKNKSIDRSVHATCKICSPSIVSHAKEYCSIFRHKEPALYICDCLITMRVLSLTKCDLKEIPEGIGKLIHLRYLNLSGNDKLTTEHLQTVCRLYNLTSLILQECNLYEIPRDIGKLIRLRHLGLSYNEYLKELPESICDLHELRSLHLAWCKNLSGLPQGAHKLANLKHLDMDGAFSEGQFPDRAIGQLSGLRSLVRFDGKLSCLKNLNQISGYFLLIIPKMSGEEDIVEEAREAELNKKVRLDKLYMKFSIDDRNEGGDEHVFTGVLGALEPPSNLSYMGIQSYMGFGLPDWIASPLNKVKHIELHSFHNLTSLLPLGRLPCLEQLEVFNLSQLEFVGRELLGITGDAANIVSSSSKVGFPKLKVLKFDLCPKWREWEDITAEEETSTSLLLFPCLMELVVINCRRIYELPHHLLHKKSSLEELRVYGSPRLAGNYDKNDEDNSYWKFISHIPRVRISF